VLVQHSVTLCTGFEGRAVSALDALLLLQVKVNVLLLECLSTAQRWPEARRHIEALHRSLPMAKQRGPAAAVALEAVAAWRATCLVKAAAGRAWEEMPRLLSELSTPHAKVRTGPTVVPHYHHGLYHMPSMNA
jgi:hypothetical protein